MHMYFNADFAMQISSEYMKYDMEEYYCPTSSISMRKVHVNMILIENCCNRTFNSSLNYYNNRVRATGRNCRQCEEKMFLAQKNIVWRKRVAKTSGEKQFSAQKIGILISPIWAILCHLIAS